MRGGASWPGLRAWLLLGRGVAARQDLGVLRALLRSALVRVNSQGFLLGSAALRWLSL